MTKQANYLNLPKSRSHLATYKLLSSVNDIFTSVDDYQKIRVDLNFDIAILESDVYNSLSNPDPEKIEEIKDRLNLWRQVLEKFDSETTVGKLRHYFEDPSTATSLMLEHLLTFYLTKPERSREERDKTDLVITRFARMSFHAQEKDVLLPSQQLKTYLEDIFRTLDLQMLDTFVLKEQVSWIENERKKLLTVESLREMLDKQVLLKIRKLKSDLGDLFFQPEILAEVVALNITLHNVFQDLFVAEQSRLTPFLESQETSPIQIVTAAEQALASVIERPKQPESTSFSNPVNVSESVEKNLNQVSIDRQEVMEIIHGMRNVLVLLDQHLQMLSEKLES